MALRLLGRAPTWACPLPQLSHLRFHAFAQPITPTFSSIIFFFFILFSLFFNTIINFFLFFFSKKYFPNFRLILFFAHFHLVNTFFPKFFANALLEKNKKKVLCMGQRVASNQATPSRWPSLSLCTQLLVK
ncbi:unnamed protein product [Meloidogyne enterolobii]|uniref:Uncharacterized protein n=1 Tax=Meloidogyne enterolobii TaxID=390850 RepID=A0ACB0Y659_MELEN